MNEGRKRAAAVARNLLEMLLRADDIPTRNDAEEMAKRILKLREEGRANEVTEEMMEQADPSVMAAYTPIDMSTDARMERASLLGFRPDEKSYHGAVDNPERHAFDSDITPVYTSDNAAVSNTYTAGEDGSMFDLLVKQGPSDNVSDQIIGKNQRTLEVDVDGTSYNVIDPRFQDRTSGDAIMDFFDNIDAEDRSKEHWFKGEHSTGPVVSTDTIAYAMRDEGVPHARIENVRDRGPYSPRAHPLGGFGRSRSFEDYKKTDAENREWERNMQSQSRKASTDQITFDDGGRLRSRFARFDPEFSHLKNLSAMSVPASVGMAQLLQSGDVTQQDIEDYLKSVGAL